jgi:hypothetical protein
MALKYSKWPQNIATFSILRPSKIYPNWDFWSENIPSGNLARDFVCVSCAENPRAYVISIDFWRPKSDTKSDLTNLDQGCQMDFFETKNPYLGKFWRVLQWKMLVYFMAIWSILRPYGIFYGHLVHVFFPFWYVVPIKI